MNGAPHRVKLLTFATRVLSILEAQDEWSADTLDDIAASAFSLGLATQDDNMMFKQTRTYNRDQALSN